MHPHVILLVFFRFCYAGSDVAVLSVIGWLNESDCELNVITAVGPFHLHNLAEMRVSSTATVTEPPSFAPLPSSRTIDATGRLSGDATSPGLSQYICLCYLLMWPKQQTATLRTTRVSQLLTCYVSSEL